jgi:flagellar protein FlaG
MATDFKLDDVFSENTSQPFHPKKIGPVEAVKSIQDLPDDGKDLPPGDGKTQFQSNKFQSNKLNDAVKQLNQHIQLVRRELQFSIDEDSGDSVITVLDRQTGEIIRQIPNEEALAFARRLDEGLDLELYSSYI